MLMTSLLAQAGIPYKDSIYEFKQPNGEKLRVHLDGNDYYAEQRTDDGSLVVFDAARKGVDRGAGDQCQSAQPGRNGQETGWPEPGGARPQGQGKV
jgi:hypothetical protein